VPIGGAGTSSIGAKSSRVDSLPIRNRPTPIPIAFNQGRSWSRAWHLLGAEMLLLSPPVGSTPAFLRARRRARHPIAIASPLRGGEEFAAFSRLSACDEDNAQP
jgi:hypothetical protein